MTSTSGDAMGRGGYRPGAGRKPGMTFPEGYRRDPDKVRKVYAFATIAGTPEEIARLKERAREAGKTVSRFVLDGLAGPTS